LPAAKIKCLVLDHDDTAVASTPVVHYPAHVEVMRRLRPGVPPVDVAGWYLKNFDPGVMSFLRDELGFTDEELRQEMEVWRRHTRSSYPAFYEGFVETLSDFRQVGGLVTVISHSEAAEIERHYASAGFPPDAVIGWHDDPERRKPHPGPLEKLLARFALAPEEALVVDDLRPGVVMAQAAGVPAAAAGWAHRIPEIERFMRAHCVVYFETVADFRCYVLSRAGADVR
jgi:phosphoglycolate phosphatase/pyrophosphatase PpaX